jgi:hypothetical protein
MKKSGEFVVSAFVGGLLTVVPIYLTVLLLLKAMNSVVGLVRPFAMLLPGWLLLRQGNRSRRYDISG